MVAWISIDCLLFVLKKSSPPSIVRTDETSTIASLFLKSTEITLALAMLSCPTGISMFASAI